jgi:tetratricopeptide (TPR) repeat protein
LRPSRAARRSHLVGRGVVLLWIDGGSVGSRAQRAVEGTLKLIFTMATSDTRKRAIGFYRAGMLDRADALCKAMIDAKPDDFDALDLLALIQCRRGHWGDALASYNNLLAIKPHYAEMYYGRGNALCALRRDEEAVASYDLALALKPDFAEALNNRGLALRKLKRLQEALDSYDRALALRPDFADALCNRGNILRDLDRHQQALANYDQALAIKPEFAGAWYGRGNALRDLKRPQEALASYDRALAVRPDFAEALNNRGGIFPVHRRPSYQRSANRPAIA